MEIISAIVMLAVVAAPLALLAGWFVRGGYEGLGSFVDCGDREGWWRAAMPLPHGVQEEDGVGWHVPTPEHATESRAVRETRGEPVDALRIAPVRPTPRVVFRSSASIRGPHR
jgi:hypothetical protein